MTQPHSFDRMKHRVLLGGYSSEVPPLPIPNREVKLTNADGTAYLGGRVGSRLFKPNPTGFGFFVFVYKPKSRCWINFGLKRRLVPIIYTIPPNLPLIREACCKAAPCSPLARWVMIGIDG